MAIKGASGVNISGLQTLTLLDFPGKVACTVFTFGCNLRCPFCHNASLVTGHFREHMSQDAFFTFLDRRVGLLDGVAITGGEPLLWPDISDFIRRIRKMGFAVKLDTNGTFPDTLSALLEENLLDYVAMDIKNAPYAYPQTVGIPDFDISPVRKSAEILMRSELPFEFRTTLVRGLHTPREFEAIGEWLAGDENYFLQTFVDSGDLLGQSMEPCSPDETIACLDAIKQRVPRAALRG